MTHQNSIQYDHERNQKKDQEKKTNDYFDVPHIPKVFLELLYKQLKYGLVLNEVGNHYFHNRSIQHEWQGDIKISLVIL